VARAVIVILVALVFTSQPAEARTGKDPSRDVRVAGICGAGATAKLRLKADEGEIEVRFEVEQRRGGALWRVALVQERRVVWKGSARTTRGDSSFELRRTLPDLPGSDTVTARAWGPRGLTCRATATLA
jgi:hypothetical protein